MTAASQTTIPPDFTTADSCPPYCDLRRGHPVDGIVDEHCGMRGHGGPKFGSLLIGGADEYTHSVGVFRPVVELYVEDEAISYTSADELKEFARQVAAAAAWLREVQP